MMPSTAAGVRVAVILVELLAVMSLRTAIVTMMTVACAVLIIVVMSISGMREAVTFYLGADSVRSCELCM